MFTRRFKSVLLPALLVSLALLYFVAQNHYQIKNALSYATRPLWDVAEGPKHIIPHYYAEGLDINEQTCKIHGWKPRKGTYKVLDAILMSSELDLLELRLNELDPVVDRFYIIESNATFTGLPKETYFASNRARFKHFEKKISYRFIPGYPLSEGQTAWDVEANTRNTMSRFLRSHMTEFLPETQSLVLMSDIDEIPSAHTVELLRVCDFGSSLHLQMRNYLYSFEWFLGMSSWRASIHLWNKDSFYRHSKSSENVLADSGWHCSYCFRTIPEYVMKMQGFSHSDRIGGRLDLLEPKRIQDIICQGKDIFDMLPEAYSYVDLLSQMHLEPLTTAVNLPLFLIENTERFKFLLPGGCVRQPEISTDDDIKR